MIYILFEKNTLFVHGLAFFFLFQFFSVLTALDI